MKRTVKKAGERRGKIIKAARKIFLTKEYVKVTMQELMDNLSALDTMKMFSTADTMSEDHARIFDMLHHPANIKMNVRQFGRYLTKLDPLYAAVIEDGCTQGIFKTEHPLEGAEFLLTGIQFLTDVGFYPWNEEQLVQRMEAFPALVEALLQAPKGSFSFLAE